MADLKSPPLEASLQRLDPWSEGDEHPPARLDADGELHGRLITTPVPGGKRLQPCRLVLDSGDAVLLSQRPCPEYFAFERKRVSIRGFFSNPALEHPDRQAVRGWRFVVEGIRLQAGEDPHDPMPARLPAPVRVVSCAGLAACRDPYARIVGTLVAGAVVDGWTVSIRLMLEDSPLEISRLSTNHPAGSGLRLLLQPREVCEMRDASLKQKRPAKTRTTPVAFGDMVTVVVALDDGGLTGLRLCLGDQRRCED